jgi:hypothetical protein
MPPAIVLVHRASAQMPSPRSREKEFQMSVTNAHAPVVLEQASLQPGLRSDPQDRPSASPDRPTRAEMLSETVPLISAPAFFGPPVIFILGPWLLLVLLLIPPAALLITLMVVVLLGAGLLAALGALIASPFLLVRHLRARHRLARPAPAVGEGSFKRSVRPSLIHLTTR